MTLLLVVLMAVGAAGSSVAQAPSIVAAFAGYWAADSADAAAQAAEVIVAAGVELDEANQVVIDGRSFVAFPRRRPSGRVEVRRSGNEIQVPATAG